MANSAKVAASDVPELSKRIAPELEPASLVKFTARVFVTLGMGLLAGWCFVKARVSDPIIIRRQFVFTNFSMLKMFLGAVASGQLVLSLLYLFPATRSHVKDVRNRFPLPTRHAVLPSTLGAILLGIGMALSGACPGTVWAQVGTKVENSGIVVAGCATGSLLYTLLIPFVDPLTLKGPRIPDTMQTVDAVLSRITGKAIPYPAVALGMVGMLAGALVLLEYFFSWDGTWRAVPSRSELPPPAALLPANNVMEQFAWPPWVSGVMLGVMQLPAALVCGDTLGSSASWMVLWAQAHRVLPARYEPFLKPIASGYSNWWQVFYVASVIPGSAFSALASRTLIDNPMPSMPAEPAAAFIGGVLMLVGSRLAAGCTSGHGLSGMALLSINSFIMVPAMFAGAIATAFLFSETDTLRF